MKINKSDNKQLSAAKRKIAQLQQQIRELKDAHDATEKDRVRWRTSSTYWMQEAVEARNLYNETRTNTANHQLAEAHRVLAKRMGDTSAIVNGPKLPFYQHDDHGNTQPYYDHQAWRNHLNNFLTCDHIN